MLLGSYSSWSALQRKKKKMHEKAKAKLVPNPIICKIRQKRFAFKLFCKLSDVRRLQSGIVRQID